MKIALLFLLSLLFSLSSQASSSKKLGESGGTKDSTLDKLGKPSMAREFSAPNFVVNGVGPIACNQANALQTIDVWVYKEANGFYQILFSNNKLICLRWSSSADPFKNIQP